MWLSTRIHTFLLLPPHPPSPSPQKPSYSDDKKPPFSSCLCALCQEAVVTAFMRNNNCRHSDTETHATMFQWKSNSEKFFKCFQHISMKHRPSWNHLDLKQMHWLFSQQAFLLGAGTGTLARAVQKGFQPPASVCYSLWHDQYLGEQQRKLREDYEDEASDRITVQDLFFLSPWSSSVSDLDGTPSGHRPKMRGGQGVKGIGYHTCWEPGHCVFLRVTIIRQGQVLEQIRSESHWFRPRRMPASLAGLAHSRCTVIGNQDFQYLFITIDTVTSPICTFLP